MQQIVISIHLQVSFESFSCGHEQWKRKHAGHFILIVMCYLQGPTICHKSVHLLILVLFNVSEYFKPSLVVINPFQLSVVCFRCSVLDFKLSKSQKKKLKRFHNFLAHGKRNPLKSNNDVSESPSDIDSGGIFLIHCAIRRKLVSFNSKIIMNLKIRLMAIFVIGNTWPKYTHSTD